MPLILLTGYPCSGLTYRAQQLQTLLDAKIESLNADDENDTLSNAGHHKIHNNNDSTAASQKLRSKTKKNNKNHIITSTHLISAHHTLHDRTVYADVRRAEKDARGLEFSAIKRELRRDRIVIVDALNYIKGFRYQVWCCAKEVGTRMAVVHVGTSVAGCRGVLKRRKRRRTSVDVSEWEGKREDEVNGLGDVVAVAGEIGNHDDDDDGKNGDDEGVAGMMGGNYAAPDEEEPYDPEVFENLIFRYEEPNGMNRWDSPLFTVLWEDQEPPIDQIWDALVEEGGKGRIVKSHQATVLPSPSAPSHLHHLDLTTQRIITHILSVQRDNPSVAEIPIPSSILSPLNNGSQDDGGGGGGDTKKVEPEDNNNLVLELPSSTTMNPVMLPQLQRLRRQFIALNRRHDVPVTRAGVLFVEFLGESLRGGSS